MTGPVSRGAPDNRSSACPSSSIGSPGENYPLTLRPSPPHQVDRSTPPAVKARTESRPDSSRNSNAAARCSLRSKSNSTTYSTNSCVAPLSSRARRQTPCPESSRHLRRTAQYRPPSPWAPSLDGCAKSRRIVVRAIGSSRFDQQTIYATSVPNTSIVGNQLPLAKILARL
jgi:hypothetical protein